MYKILDSVVSIENIIYVNNCKRLIPNWKSKVVSTKRLSLRHCLITRIERSVGRDYRASISREHANTQGRRSVLQGTQDDTWEWPLAQSYDFCSRHSLRFASASWTQSCPLYPGFLTSLLNGHASLCLPQNAFQTAKYSEIETSCPTKNGELL